MTIIKGKAFKPKSEREEDAVVETETYIDLSEMSFEGDAADAQMLIKVGEIYRYEDLAAMTSCVYNGNVMLIDITSISNDDLTLKRVTNDLRNVVRDVGGDLAGVGKNMLMIAPSGVRIDRNKIRGGF